jgi:hypothetical protein
MFDMKTISVGSSVLTHLALVPSAVTNTDLPAIYYDRAAFPTQKPQFSSVAVRQCLLDPQFYTVLDAFLEQFDTFFPLSVCAGTQTSLISLPIKSSSCGTARCRLGKPDLIPALKILALKERPPLGSWVIFGDA